MPPHELMELLLFYAIPRRDVNALAHVLIEHFGSVDGVLHADRKALMSISGIGARTAEFLVSLGDLVEAYADLRSVDRPMLGNLQLFRKFVRSYRGILEEAETWQFCLTYEGRLLIARPIAQNTAWAEPEYLRGALEDVISSHAHSVLLAQYVLEDQPNPTEYDQTHTEKYARALRRMDVHLLDHILVGADSIYSMHEKNDLHKSLSHGSLDTIGERYMGPPPTNRNRLREEDPANERFLKES